MDYVFRPRPPTVRRLPAHARRPAPVEPAAAVPSHPAPGAVLFQPYQSADGQRKCTAWYADVYGHMLPIPVCESLANARLPILPAKRSGPSKLSTLKSAAQPPLKFTSNSTRKVANVKWRVCTLSQQGASITTSLSLSAPLSFSLSFSLFLSVFSVFFWLFSVL